MDNHIELYAKQAEVPEVIVEEALELAKNVLGKDNTREYLWIYMAQHLVSFWKDGYLEGETAAYPNDDDC